MLAQIFGDFLGYIKTTFLNFKLLFTLFGQLLEKLVFF